MPDQYGRPTINDWAGITSAFNAIGQNNRSARQEAEKQKLKTETNNVFAALQNKQDPAKLGVGAEALTAGQQMKTGYDQNSLLSSNIEDERTVSELTKEIAATYLKGGIGADVSEILKKNPVLGLKAQVRGANLFKESDQGKAMATEARSKLQDQGWKTFEINKQLVNNAIAQGDTEQAVSALRETSKSLNVPYQFGEYDPKKGTLDVLYDDSKSGEHKPTGKMSIQEAIQRMNSLSKEQHAGAIAHAMQAKNLQNEEKWGQPIHATNSIDGRNYLIVPQSDLYGFNGTNYVVTDAETGEQQIFKSKKEMFELGFRQEDLEWKGKVTKIAADEALIDQRRSAEIKNYADRDLSAFKRKEAGKKQWAIKREDGGYDVVSGTVEEASKYRDMGYEVYNAEDYKASQGINKTEIESKDKASKKNYNQLGVQLEVAFPNNVMVNKDDDGSVNTIEGEILLDDFKQIQSIVNQMGATIISKETGKPVDTNSWLPGGKEKAIKFSVIPGVRKVAKISPNKQALESLYDNVDTNPGSRTGSALGKKNSSKKKTIGEHKLPEKMSDWRVIDITDNKGVKRKAAIGEDGKPILLTDSELEEYKLEMNRLLRDRYTWESKRKAPKMKIRSRL